MPCRVVIKSYTRLIGIAESALVRKGRNRRKRRSGGAREGWLSRCLVFLFEKLKELSSPYINRFLSADTIVPNPANAQSLNRYRYVMNNPLRYIDPTGHSGCELYQGVCLSENQMTEIYNDTTGNGNNNDDDDDDDPVGGGGSQPQPSPVPNQTPDDDDEILCNALANGNTCIESSLTSGELNWLLGNLYTQSDNLASWGTGLVITGAFVLGAITILSLPALALAISTVAIISAVTVGTGLLVAGGIMLLDATATSNLASNISLGAGSESTQIAVMEGSNNPIAMLGDNTTFSSFDSNAITGWSTLTNFILDH